MEIKWNAQQAARYRSAGLWTDRTLLDCWEEAVERYGDAVYVTADLGRTLSYRETDR